MSKSLSKKSINKYSNIPRTADFEVNTVNCNSDDIKGKQDNIKENLKRINKIQKKCQSRHIKDEYKEEITLRQLLGYIKKENKSNVIDFLELFPVLGEGKTTVNTVYEALWILVFLYRLDDFDNKYSGTVGRVFYTKLESPKVLEMDKILDGKVNEGNKGGIVDIYFEITDIVANFKKQNTI